MIVWQTKNDISVNRNACKNAILIRKYSQPLRNTFTTYDGKLLKQKRVYEINPSSVRCINSRNNTKFLSFNNQSMVEVNKIKKLFNMKFASGFNTKK